MEKLNDLAIVVCSCDKYKSVWTPFFTLLNKYFNPLPKDVYLLTETTEIPKGTSSKWCKNGGGVKIFYSAEKCWSKRIKEALKQIKNEYVLFHIEDFFLQDFVKMDGLHKVMDWIRQDENISAIRLYPFWEDFTNDWPKYRDEFFVIDRNYEERVNAQVAIWRREHLIEILNDNESAWQFEIMASNRSRKDPYLYLGYYEPLSLKGIYPYQFAPANGYGITAGKWLWNNEKFFQEQGIECDFSQLGVMSEKEWTRNYKSKWRKFVRRITKLKNIIKEKRQNKEKIKLKEIINSSMIKTSFQLLNDVEYREYSAKDLQLIDNEKR